MASEIKRSSRGASRRAFADQSFRSAAECIGPCVAGLSRFAITRGQWSMIDAILHVLDCVGKSRLTIWTWTVAEYEVQVLQRLMLDSRLSAGRLIIDHGARDKNSGIIKQWKDTFGPDSVRYVLNHAKIATIESETGLRFLLRGSMNLNFNARFENFDITEGGEDFDLVQEIEEELEILPDNCSGKDVFKASKVSKAFDAEQLEMFQGVKVWAK